MIERWQPYSIGNLGRVVTGKTPPSSRPECFGEDFPFITPSDIGSDTRKVETERYLSMVGKQSMPNYLLPEKTVCVVCIGATIGKVCMTHRASTTNQQINSIVVDEQRFDPHFVYYTMRKIGPSLLGLASGAATPIINKSSFSNVEITAPKLPTQRRIASILSAYDDLIENNICRISILEEMARRIYEGWFVHFRFPGHEQAKMVESELGLIPEGWSWQSLRDIAMDVRNGVNPESTAPTTPYVGLEHIPRRSIGLTEWGFASEVQSTKLRFQRGDILFGKIRPYFHKVAVAPVAGVASSDAIVIRAKEPKWYSLVLATVSSDAFVAEATQSSNGTKMPRANWNVLLGYKVPQPTEEVLGKFNEVMGGIVDFIRVATLKNRNLRTTRDLLLPKLISGEIDVSNLPNPEEVSAV